jgi:cyanophycinase-like exopeptidase
MLRVLLFCLLANAISAQNYVSYFTGDTTDINTPTKGGVVLMGGATEDDNAMRWFLNQSGGGDIVVIRASGSNGYNNYLYSELGVTVHSVQTIVTPDSASAQWPYVAHQIRNAEALWIAGGDQAKYVRFWKNNHIEDAIQYLISEKKVVVGGTSAGMAILGDAYFAALNGSVTSAEVLANPYHVKATIGADDFIQYPDLEYVITDTHYDSPDRRGRHSAFLARLAQDLGWPARGIASEEYTAVCVDSSGMARVFGGYPQYEDFAYFIQVNCENDPAEPENCVPASPLNWVRNNAALRVLKAEGTAEGKVQFNLRDWKTHTGGGTWQNWWVANGVLNASAANGAAACTSNNTELPTAIKNIQVWPNPASQLLHIVLPKPVPMRVRLLDPLGRIVVEEVLEEQQSTLPLPDGLSDGIYWLDVFVSRMESIGQRVVIYAKR